MRVVAPRNKAFWILLYLPCLGNLIYLRPGTDNAVRSFESLAHEPAIKKDRCINADKVFCIGMFKTGTTSCKRVLQELGYECEGRPCGFLHDMKPEKMWDDAAARDYYTLERVGRHDLDQSMSANDGPWLFMFEELYQHYGNSSRFVYTQRDLRELINSDINHFWIKSDDESPSSFEEALFLKTKKMGLDIVSSTMAVVRRYRQHQQRVEAYFRDRPDLIIKVDLASSFNDKETTAKERRRLEEFLGCPLSGETMPHQNNGRLKTKKTGKSYYEISDQFWEFLLSYDDFNFDRITKGHAPFHKSTNKTAYSTWVERMTGADITDVTSLPPLFIGMGQGTTGTRSMYSATCMLGLPGVHYHKTCYTTAQVNSVHLGLTFGKHSTCPVEHHLCRNEDPVKWARTLKRKVDKMVQSNVVAVHDWPYTSVLPYLIKATQRMRKVHPVLLFSERDPHQWAKRRLKHVKKLLFVCTEYLTNREKADKDAFDVIECIERAASKQKKSGSNVTIGFNDIFTQISAMEDNQAVEVLAQAVQDFQNKYRPYAVYGVNLFTSNMTVGDLASDISGIVSTLPKGTQDRLASLPLVSNEKRSSAQMNHMGGASMISHINPKAQKVTLKENDASPPPPLVISIGQKATGKNTVYSATCKLGLPSVRFLKSCYANARVQAFQHDLAFHRLFKCSVRPCAQEDVVAWASELKNLVDEVIQGNIVAVHESPYTFLLSYLMDAAKRMRGVPPVLVLSEKDPREWAEKRVQKAKNYLFVCTEYVDNREGAYKDAFDVISCIERAAKRNGGSNSTLHFADVFTSVSSLEDKQAIHVLSQGMQDFQDLYRPHAAFRIDSLKGAKSADDIASDISRIISSAQNRSEAISLDTVSIESLAVPKTEKAQKTYKAAHLSRMRVTKKPKKGHTGTVQQGNSTLEQSPKRATKTLRVERTGATLNVAEQHSTQTKEVIQSEPVVNGGVVQPKQSSFERAQNRPTNSTRKEPNARTPNVAQHTTPMRKVDSNEPAVSEPKSLRMERTGASLNVAERHSTQMKEVMQNEPVVNGGMLQPRQSSLEGASNSSTKSTKKEPNRATLNVAQAKLRRKVGSNEPAVSEPKSLRMKRTGATLNVAERHSTQTKEVMQSKPAVNGGVVQPRQSSFERSSNSSTKLTRKEPNGATFNVAQAKLMRKVGSNEPADSEPKSLRMDRTGATLNVDEQRNTQTKEAVPSETIVDGSMVQAPRQTSFERASNRSTTLTREEPNRATLNVAHAKLMRKVGSNEPAVSKPHQSTMA